MKIYSFELDFKRLTEAMNIFFLPIMVLTMLPEAVKWQQNCVQLLVAP